MKENKRLNDEAAKVMDKKYPGGWSQSATNMAELQKHRKAVKKRSSW